ncbi:MAG: sialate O-acetylesterase, partial [Planctomycetota bacterium]
MLICSRWILHRSLPVFSGLLIAMLPSIVKGELMMSSIFGDSMVLQRDHPIHVWGWTEPQTTVTVTLADRRATGQSDQDGRFDVSLPAMRAGGPFEMTVEAGESRTFTDVLIGEVWICSGQSNMQWSVGQSDDGDLEQLAAKYPQMRIISVPQVGTQEPQRDFDGQWQSVTPESVPSFSAVGYFFGRQLHQTLDVPVGLIDNAWGGSAAEAWTPRDVLASNEATASLIPQWEQRMANYDFASQLADWEAKRAAWVAEGKKGRLP